MSPTLHTERLVLTPYRPADEAAFVALLGDEVVRRWMGQDELTEAEIRGVFRTIIDEIYPRRLFDAWGVWYEDTCVGHAEIKKTGNVDGYEMIAALARPYWRQGLGSELARRLIRYGAENLGVDHVYGMVGAGNTASLALCEKLGFRRVRDVVSDDGTSATMVVIATRP